MSCWTAGLSTELPFPGARWPVPSAAQPPPLAFPLPPEPELPPPLRSPPPALPVPLGPPLGEPELAGVWPVPLPDEGAEVLGVLGGGDGWGAVCTTRTG
jgi:hypothetical protein